MGSRRNISKVGTEHNNRARISLLLPDLASVDPVWQPDAEKRRLQERKATTHDSTLLNNLSMIALENDCVITYRTIDQMRQTTSATSE